MEARVTVVGGRDGRSGREGREREDEEESPAHDATLPTAALRVALSSSHVRATCRHTF
jgi:hypothetical protein